MRALVFTLALAISPIGPAVCELVCADRTVAGHHAAPVAETVAPEHHHHGDMAPEAGTALARATEVPPGGLNGRVADCAPPSSQPATLRTAVTPRVNALTGDVAATTVHALELAQQHTGGPPIWSSPPTPLRSAIPLRI